ncbi:MAG: SRPBCC family protein [Planctomycetota bacterium]|jgi:ligand-binding SRPBCC domain-containing protein
MSIEFEHADGTSTLTSEMWLPEPRESVFGFFADAGNLQRVTPPWLNFRILTNLSVEMRPGLLIDYHLRLRGVPLRWQSEITVWEPPHRFVDEMRIGPYREWIHEHRFEEHEGGTRVIDQVRYAVPGGAVVDRLFVRRDLKEIFRYRQERLGPELNAMLAQESQSHAAARQHWTRRPTGTVHAALAPSRPREQRSSRH